MILPAFSRRATLAGLAATLASACAKPAAKPLAEPPVMVNLAEVGAGADLAASADRARRMTAPVTLNGLGPYAFVVDTGANHSVLALDLADALSLPRGRREMVHGIAGAEPAETALIDRLNVGQITARRVRAPLLERSRLGVDGLLGVDVLRNRAVTLDFAQNRFVVSTAQSYSVTASADSGRLRAALPADPAEVVVAARQRFGQLVIIDAQVGRIPVTAFLDSGSENTVGNLSLARLLERDGLIHPVQQEVEMIGVTGQQARGRLSPIPPLRLGGLIIGQLSAVLTDLHVFKLWELERTPAILLGMDVMRHFRSIKLDFAHRLVTFRAPGRLGDEGRMIEVR